jgi:patatin-like phospholipase
VAPFLIGINMAGAVSAGAYTAGVLDFLIEALDAWYAAKAAGQPVPAHDVSIEVFSGASAGGMCAAIASVMVQGEFDHIHDANRTGTANRFYESWVNKIDILELLKTDDIKKGGPVISLLDCSIIDEIAEYALQPGASKPRKYISPSLTLFLTLTNVTGIPYALDPAAPSSADEGTLYHADWLRFETVQPGQQTTEKIARPLPLGQPNQGKWGLLREAAKATGAFPIFLAPRFLEREKSEYDVPRWESVNPAARSNNALIKPAWPANVPDPFHTLNVDGGVIDNDPFNLAHDYLACVNASRKKAGGNTNPRGMNDADAAVISVAPFPSTYEFHPNAPLADAAVTKGIGNLASVLITQSRFFGESLAVITDPEHSSRFLIAPSDDSVPASMPALQCASLGAFGGFFSRGFRAHDFLLGRRNCQWFLRTQFVLPESNPLMGTGMAGLNAQQLASFAAPASEGKAAVIGQTLYPIIPLCTPELQRPVAAPARAKMSEERLDEVVNAIYQRVRAVGPALTDGIGAAWVRGPLQAVERIVALVGLGKGALKDAIREQLGDSIA